jgi:transaldolase
MAAVDYLTWLSGCRPTTWWHDSADPGELEAALVRGAVGVTTNPVLVPDALRRNADLWGEEIARVVRDAESPGGRAESLMRIAVTHAASRLAGVFEATGGESGWVCAQVDPSLAGSRDAMEEMGRRFAAWAPNIAVKLPATAAGLDVLERLSADGIAVTATVSFTVAQAVAIAERAEGSPGRCFAVLMVGRLDDYLREVFSDAGAGIAEAEVQQAGLAVAREAHAIYRRRGYRARLMIAAFRQAHQVAGMCGADAVLSIHPRYQRLLLESPMAREPGIDQVIDPRTLARLKGQPEFLRSFTADGIPPSGFLSFGLTQRTLAQFTDGGWKLLESFEAPAAGA